MEKVPHRPPNNAHAHTSVDHGSSRSGLVTTELQELSKALRPGNNQQRPEGSAALRAKSISTRKGILELILFWHLSLSELALLAALSWLAGPHQQGHAGSQ